MHGNEALRLIRRGFEAANARATAATERPRRAPEGTRGPSSGDMYTFIMIGRRILNDLLDREAQKDYITTLSMDQLKIFLARHWFLAQPR